MAETVLNHGTDTNGCGSRNAPPLRDGQRVLIAVDGGGTRTRCAAFDEAGQLQATAETGPSNHLVSDGERAFASLTEAISAVMTACGAAHHQVHAISAGLAGVDAGGEGLLEAQRCLASLGFANSIIHADIVTAHAGAFGGEPGVLALAGTGAAFLGVTKDLQHVHGGGWGPVCGDEGSAYWIGRQSLQAAAAAYDGRGPKTALLELICEALELKTFAETLHSIYRSPLQVRLIADLSRVAETAGNAGDHVANGILEQAGDELAAGVEAVVRRMHGAVEDCEVTWEGSVLRNSAAVRERFRRSLGRRLPGISILPPRFDPVFGAYLLGRRALGWEIGTP
jgi:N-acetylglucosamine kinase-like BadF-type ATPase